MKRNRLKYLVLAALLGALATAMTLLAHVPFPMTSEGYVHLGDGVVYITACLLPAPYAAAAAAIGCGLADLGFINWLPATVVIKACMALMFTTKQPKMLCRRNLLALLPATLINVGGYYLYEGFIYGNWAAAMASAVGNVIQSGFAALLFIVLAAAMDRVRLKDKLLK